MKKADITVDLIDHMGSDLTVVNAARVSFNKESTLDNGVLSEKDEKLIKYLAEHGHWSPSSATTIQFRVKAPIFLARQLVKHFVGNAWNEVSRRYVDYEPEFYVPESWRGRPEGSLKQGSSDTIDRPELADAMLESATNHSLNIYSELLKLNVAPELARMVLPLNAMTEWYWTGSLYYWARVCKLRISDHAQYEAQYTAKLISNHCAALFPVSWKYFGPISEIL